jgi:hypothetical protein
LRWWAGRWFMLGIIASARRAGTAGQSASTWESRIDAFSWTSKTLRGSIFMNSIKELTVFPITLYR